MYLQSTFHMNPPLLLGLGKHFGGIPARMGRDSPARNIGLMVSLSSEKTGIACRDGTADSSTHTHLDQMPPPVSLSRGHDHEDHKNDPMCALPTRAQAPRSSHSSPAAAVGCPKHERVAARMSRRENPRPGHTWSMAETDPPPEILSRS